MVVALSPDRGQRGLRASSLIALVVLGLAALGILYLATSEQDREVYTAAADLPAFHQIREEDLRLAAVPKKDLPARAVTLRESAIGRYTLSPVLQDAPLTTDRLGPQLTPGALVATSIIGVEARVRTTAGGTLARGDRVDLFRPASTIGDKTWTLTNVLVLDIRGGPEALVLALAPDQKSEVGSIPAADRLLVARVSAYRRP